MYYTYACFMVYLTTTFCRWPARQRVGDKQVEFLTPNGWVPAFLPFITETNRIRYESLQA